MHKIYLTFIALLLLSANVCKAEEKSAEELCRQRNLASCEISGLKFFIDDDCPRGAKVLRPKGRERCDQLAAGVTAAASAVMVAPPVQPQHEASPAAADESSGFWGNILYVLAVVGFLQGLSTRVGLWPLLFVAVILPLLATWGWVSDTYSHAISAEYLVYTGKEFLWHSLFSVAGWITGSALHYGLLKFIASRAGK